jgi:hypothetical protein
VSGLVGSNPTPAAFPRNRLLKGFVALGVNLRTTVERIKQDNGIEVGLLERQHMGGQS